MNKKVIIICSVVLIFTVVLFFFIKRKEVPNKFAPNLKFVQLSITNITSEAIEIESAIQIDNKLPIDFKIDSIDYKIRIDSVTVVENTYTDSLKFNANSKTPLTLPLKIYIKDLSEINDRINRKGKDSAQYIVELDLYVKHILVPKNNVFVSVTKKMPLLQLPLVKLNKMEFKKVGIPNSTLNAEVMFYNPNPFSVGMKDVQSKLSISENQIVQNLSTDKIYLEERDTSYTNINFKFNLNETFNSVANLIKEGEDTPVHFELNSIIVSENELLNNAHFQMFYEGSLKKLNSVNK